MKISRAVLGLCLFVLGSGCASWERQSSQVPAGMVQLAELSRSDYRVGARVSGEATVHVKRNMLQKLLAPIFGRESVDGDQSVVTGFGTTNEKTTSGTRGIGMSAASSLQLGDLIGIVLGQLGVSAGGGSSAIAHATAAAYFRALESTPGADFLLEPRVNVVTRGSSSIFFFVEDDETATVTVSGRPVTIVADGEQRRAPPVAAPQSAAAAVPTAESAPSPTPDKAAAPDSTEIEIGRHSLLELDASIIRSLKQLIGAKVIATLASGETRSGSLQKVERAGLTIDGAVVAWDAVVAVKHGT